SVKTTARLPTEIGSPGRSASLAKRSRKTWSAVTSAAVAAWSLHAVRSSTRSSSSSVAFSCRRVDSLASRSSSAVQPFESSRAAVGAPEVGERVRPDPACRQVLCVHDEAAEPVDELSRLTLGEERAPGRLDAAELGRRPLPRRLDRRRPAGQRVVLLEDGAEAA